MKEKTLAFGTKILKTYMDLGLRRAKTFKSIWQKEVTGVIKIKPKS